MFSQGEKTRVANKCHFQPQVGQGACKHLMGRRTWLADPISWSSGFPHPVYNCRPEQERASDTSRPTPGTDEGALTPGDFLPESVYWVLGQHVGGGRAYRMMQKWSLERKLTLVALILDWDFRESCLPPVPEAESPNLLMTSLWVTSCFS